MKENLEIYEKVRQVPEEAKKEITAGRLKGKTDINPMWRIKKLTEVFGPCGFGWYTSIVERWIDDGANGEKTANIRIYLYVSIDGKWSAPIEGIGGSVLIAKETSGLRTDDDCFKKAYTDAISVACKALGVGGDVYWGKDPSKYDQREEDQNSGNRSEGPGKSNAARGAKSGQRLGKKEFCQKYGIIAFEECIASYEKRLGNRSYETWTKDEIQVVEEDLERIVKKREAERKLKAVEGEVPFDV